jgi:myo-inositol-1(or 4)-monophosphatase
MANEPAAPDPVGSSASPHPPSEAQLEAARRGGLERELCLALDCAREACAIVLRHYRAGERGWEKSKGNPVTQADLDADAAIRRRLAAAFPEDGLLTEEDEATTGTSGRTWIVDPLDGTHDFVERVPEFAVSIALVDASGEPCVGVIANPVSDIVVSAVRGGGTWRSGVRGAEPMHVTRGTKLAGAVAIASRSETRRGDWDGFASWFGSVRTMGSIAWKLAAVACAVGDLNVSVRPKHSWDICAGDLLVREAGGVYLDRHGSPPRYAPADAPIPGGMVAGPGDLVRDFLARVAADPTVLDPAPPATDDSKNRTDSV